MNHYTSMRQEGDIRKCETLAQAQQMGPWLAYVRWPIGIYLDNDVEAGAWRYPTADPEQTYDCKRIHLFVSYPVSSLPIVAFLYRLQNAT